MNAVLLANVGPVKKKKKAGFLTLVLLIVHMNRERKSEASDLTRLILNKTRQYTRAGHCVIHT